MEKNYLTNAVNLAKDIALKKLKKGDTAIDATAGNGNDTLFLAKVIGSSGKVYSFDIQDIALINTKKKLTEENLLSCVSLICDGHENMDKYVNEKAKVIMFNLGYLPNASHNITTKGETTIKALTKSLNILDKNGVILIVIYYGYDNGKKEKRAIEDFVSNLNQKEYNVIKLEFVNQINNPPILIAIEKR